MWPCQSWLLFFSQFESVRVELYLRVVSKWARKGGNPNTDNPLWDKQISLFLGIWTRKFLENQTVVRGCFEMCWCSEKLGRPQCQVLQGQKLWQKWVVSSEKGRTQRTESEQGVGGRNQKLENSQVRQYKSARVGLYDLPWGSLGSNSSSGSAATPAPGLLFPGNF